MAAGLTAYNDQTGWGSPAELCIRVQQVDGVRLGELVGWLPGPAGGGNEALAEVLRLGRQ